MSYLPLEDYALIGDTHSAGLVSKRGSIDWLCLPRFDSPSCFAAILDADDGGRWVISPADPAAKASRSYRDDSMVLETTFHSDEGTATLIDCLAVGEGEEATWSPSLPVPDLVVRIVRGERGSSTFDTEFAPRFDYGSIVPWIRKHGDAIECVGGADALDLYSSVPLEVDGGSARGRFSIDEGETVTFIAAYHPSHIAAATAVPDDPSRLVEQTDQFWRHWLDRCSYVGEWQNEVKRSLLTLKALTYAPTGGIVAAPTTSLPEEIGGVRNWDYRYCWLRDATFTLGVLLQQGFTQEAAAWRDWLLRSIAGDPADAQIMYGVQGERRLRELELDWLEGYERSRPVRIGNSAVTQFQLDVYGEVMDSFHVARNAGVEPMAEGWELQKDLVTFVCDRWTEPDEGIWEVRSGPENFVHSKVMAWVALDRAIDAVESFGREGPVDRWRRTRSLIHEEIHERGVDRERGCYVRAYGSRQLDASLLMLPLVGFVRPDDPLMIGTIEAIQEDLVVDGFVRRYATEHVDDGLEGDEGTFLLCTFWLVDCLWLCGRRDEARSMFERLLTLTNDVGLLAEQYDPVHRRLTGNFPQAFSHIALVTSAMTLGGRSGTPVGARTRGSG